MTNPNLASVHLHNQPRRDDYRRARELVLRARGSQTLAAERAARSALIPTRLDLPGTTTRYVLQYGDKAMPLKLGMNVLGRFADSDIVLTEGHISRRHCAVVVHVGGGCELHDLASRNGTFLNGRRLTDPVWLVSGDCITLCDRSFTFHAEANDGEKTATVLEL